jgi:hypothetical protein
MPMSDNTVEIAIKAVDQTQGAFDGLKQRMTALNGEITKSIGQATAMEHTQVSGANNAKQAYDGMVQVLGRVSPALGSIVTAVGPLGVAIAAVTAGVKAFQQAWRLAEQGADQSELAEKFVAITGGIRASEEMLQKLRKAAQGTVTDFDLMVIANRSLNMGITDNADEMARLVAYFKDLGEASGMGSQEAISAGMQALGALQVRGFKTLGLSLDDTKIYDVYAAKLGTVASKLDDVQKRAALTQELLSRAPMDLVNATSSAADKAEAMHIAVKNLNTSIGQSIQGMLGLGDAITEIANKADAALKRSLGASGLATEYQALYEKAVAQMKPQRVFNEVAQEWQDIGNVALDAALLAQKMQDVIDRFREGKISYDDARAALDAYVGASAKTELALQNTSNGMMIVANGALMIADAVKSIPTFVEITTVITQQSLSMGKPYGYEQMGPQAFIGAHGQMVVNTSGFGGDTYQDQAKRADAAAKSGASAAKAYASAYNSELESRKAELRSLATSLLTPSYRGPKDLIGPYVEQWDEYARKMNAIADDQGTIWRKMVPQDILDKGQKAVTEWARAEEAAFYAGNRLDQVDWNKFVEDAKKQVEIQQAKQDMIDMAVQKLAEAGIGGVNAAEVLGLNTPGATVGNDMAASFSSGLVSTDTAAAVTTAFQTQMKLQTETWTSVGVLCIGWFVTGLKQGVNATLGKEILLSLFPQLKKLIEVDPVLAGLKAAGL